MAKLQVKIDETRSEIYLLKTQSARLAQQVTDLLQQQQDEIIAAAMQSVWTQVQLWTQANNVGQIPTSAGHSTKYRFIWPEPKAQISQGFGPSKYWFEPAYGGYPHFHTGIDLVEPFGSPVYAADDGVVALVGSSSSGYGNFVVIAHSGGLDTLYGHLSTGLVKVGDRVTQGQAVGLEGSTGNSTGAHLHFELRINQRPVDPTPYLPPGPPSAFKGQRGGRKETWIELRASPIGWGSAGTACAAAASTTLRATPSAGIAKRSHGAWRSAPSSAQRRSAAAKRNPSTRPKGDASALINASASNACA